MHTKPILLFFHGYAASAALYYNLYKDLSEKFCIIGIDHVGMGASSWPDNYYWQDFRPDQSIGYFIEYTEVWRKQF